MTKHVTQAVSRIALRGRLMRALAAEGKVLRAASGAQARRDLGEFYVLADDKIVATHVDLATLARKMKLLKPWETPAP